MSARGPAFTAFAAAGVALGMLGLAFSAPTLYQVFCQVTGFGGTTQRLSAEDSFEVLDRMMTVRFDANTSPGLPLRFEPLQRQQTLNIGEHGLAFYEVTNTSDRPVRAVATYNVTPHKAGPYFIKLECFCFEEDLFPPGETRTLPVVYFVSAEAADNRQMDGVGTVTLSYSFFEVVEEGAEMAEASQARRADEG